MLSSNVVSSKYERSSCCSSLSLNRIEYRAKETEIVRGLRSEVIKNIIVMTMCIHTPLMYVNVFL